MKICERCFSRIEDGEEFVVLAHIGGVAADGTPQWRHSYVHTAVRGGSVAAQRVLCGVG